MVISDNIVEKLTINDYNKDSDAGGREASEPADALINILRKLRSGMED